MALNEQGAVRGRPELALTHADDLPGWRLGVFGLELLGARRDRVVGQVAALPKLVSNVGVVEGDGRGIGVFGTGEDVGQAVVRRRGVVRARARAAGRALADVMPCRSERASGVVAADRDGQQVGSLQQVASARDARVGLRGWAMTSITTPALGPLRLALEDFYVRDRELLELGAGETTLTSRLAHHLVGRVDESWDVDAEYHVQGTDGGRKFRGSMGRQHMRPDLLVHRRGLLGPDDNLLMVEVKRLWVPRGADKNDRDKARLGVSLIGHRAGVALSLHPKPLSERGVPVFEPRWTVYVLGSADLDSVPYSAVLTVDHEPVFDATELDRLVREAERFEQKRRR